MPLIIVNSKYGQGQEDKYLDTSKKNLSQEMIMCNMKALIFIILLQIMGFLDIKCQGQKVLYKQKEYSDEI